MFCSNCGSQIENNSKFCTNCGAAVEPVAQTAPQSNGSSAASAATKEQSQTQQTASSSVKAARKPMSIFFQVLLFGSPILMIINEFTPLKNDLLFWISTAMFLIACGIGFIINFKAFKPKEFCLEPEEVILYSGDSSNGKIIVTNIGIKYIHEENQVDIPFSNIENVDKLDPLSVYVNMTDDQFLTLKFEIGKQKGFLDALVKYGVVINITGIPKKEQNDAYKKGNEYFLLSPILPIKYFAIRNLNKVSKSNKNYADAALNKGLIYFMNRQYDKAIKELTEAIQTKPDLSGAYNLRGIAYQDKGEYDNAIQNYEKYLVIDPDNITTKTNLDLAKMRLPSTLWNIRKLRGFKKWEAFANVLYTNCGSQIEDNSKFCTDCGAAVESVESSETTEETPPSRIESQINTEYTPLPKTKDNAKHKSAVIISSLIIVFIVVIVLNIKKSSAKPQISTAKSTSEKSASENSASEKPKRTRTIETGTDTEPLSLKEYNDYLWQYHIYHTWDKINGKRFSVYGRITKLEGDDGDMFTITLEDANGEEFIPGVLIGTIIYFDYTDENYELLQTLNIGEVINVTGVYGHNDDYIRDGLSSCKITDRHYRY